MVTPSQLCETSQAWKDGATNLMSAMYYGNRRTIQGTVFLTGSNFLGLNLKTATFYMTKTGSPEGTIACKLYATAPINSGLGVVTETASNTVSIQTDWLDGDQEFTFSGDNDIAINNALVVVGTFTTSGSSDYINLVQDTYSPNPTEQMRQYQRESTIAEWEGQANMNARFKVCN